MEIEPMYHKLYMEKEIKDISLTGDFDEWLDIDNESQSNLRKGKIAKEFRMSNEYGTNIMVAIAHRNLDKNRPPKEIYVCSNNFVYRASTSWNLMQIYYDKYNATDCMVYKYMLDRAYKFSSQSTVDKIIALYGSVENSLDYNKIKHLIDTNKLTLEHEIKIDNSSSSTQYSEQIFIADTSHVLFEIFDVKYNMSRLTSSYPYMIDTLDYLSKISKYDYSKDLEWIETIFSVLALEKSDILKILFNKYYDRATFILAISHYILVFKLNNRVKDLFTYCLDDAFRVNEQDISRVYKYIYTTDLMQERIFEYLLENNMITSLKKEVLEGKW